MKNNTCRNCKFFNFKVSGEDVSYGECLNKKVDTYISFGKADIGDLVKGDTIEERVENIHKINDKLKKYTPVYFNEKTFGCIHFKQK